MVVPLSVRRLLCVVAAATVACTCAQQPPAGAPGLGAAAPSALDSGTRPANPKTGAPPDPCTDFYAFACGDWLAAHPIPPDSASWSQYDEMTKRNRAVVQAILQEAARVESASDPVTKTVGTYYAACMDESGVEARGIKPLDAHLGAIASIAKRADLLRVIGALARRGVDSVIDLGAEQDAVDATLVIAGADRKPFPLRVRDNYLSDDEHARTLRAAYET